MRQEEEGIRINRFLSEAGVCSRREADRAVEAGEVRIGERTAQLGERVRQGDAVYFRGRRVEQEEERILIAFNKPPGIVCTTSRREGKNIVDYIGYPRRIYPVGRLDRNSTGLILLTNQGDLVNKMMRSGNAHEKEYEVQVDRPVTGRFLEAVAGGVELAGLNQRTRPCWVEAMGEKGFRIILTQGLNRQIRRMCQAFGYQVLDLKRTRIMNIRLGSLGEGKFRQMAEDEYRELLRLLEESGSSNLPYAQRTLSGG